MAQVIDPTFAVHVAPKTLKDSCETITLDGNPLLPANTRDVEPQIASDSGLKFFFKNVIKVRRTNKKGEEVIKFVSWDVNKQGAGVLDAKRLLDKKLPTKQELLNFINQE